MSRKFYLNCGRLRKEDKINSFVVRGLNISKSFCVVSLLNLKEDLSSFYYYDEFTRFDIKFQITKVKIFMYFNK